jgi:glucose/arabinose dehydrogenase
MLFRPNSMIFLSLTGWLFLSGNDFFCATVPDVLYNEDMDVPRFLEIIRQRLLSTCGLLVLFLLPPAVVSVAEWPGITFIHVAGGFNNPVRIVNAGDGSQRLFVVEQGGTIRIIKNGTVLPVPFLDIAGRLLSGGERGLLGLAFPPLFATKGYFYVNYTREPDGATVIARFRITGNPDSADAQSEEVILVIEQPFANHNGGNLAFGPDDGFLYIGMGDGGAAGDPNNFAQNLSFLPGNKQFLGKLLRIDVESGVVPYAVPLHNPVLGGMRSEIWARGLRNPWAFSFDRTTGDMYIGDVGQGFWEEINFQPAGSSGGENYGWRIFEGNHCFTPPAGCVPLGRRYSPPIFEYSHMYGCSVTGGHVYRGIEFPLLNGVYFFGDFCSGKIWGLRRDLTAWKRHLFSDTAFSITAFGESEMGDLYVADYASGNLYKIAETITVISPNGGEILPSGGTHLIRWDALGDLTSFKLQFSTDKGVTWRPIAKNVPGLSYAWNVPAFARTKRNCRIRVIGFDAQGVRRGVDKSDKVFSIIVGAP